MKAMRRMVVWTCIVLSWCIFFEGVQLSGLVRVMTAKAQAKNIVQHMQTDKDTRVLSGLIRDIEHALQECARQKQTKSVVRSTVDACPKLAQVFAVYQPIAQVGVLEIPLFMQFLKILAGIGTAITGAVLAKIAVIVAALLVVIVLAACVVHPAECKKHIKFFVQQAQDAFKTYILPAMNQVLKFSGDALRRLEKEVNDLFTNKITPIITDIQKNANPAVLFEKAKKEFVDLMMQFKKKGTPVELKPVPTPSNGNNGNNGNNRRKFDPPKPPGSGGNQVISSASSHRSDGGLRYPTQSQLATLATISKVCAQRIADIKDLEEVIKNFEEFEQKGLKINLDNLSHDLKQKMDIANKNLINYIKSLANNPQYKKDYGDLLNQFAENLSKKPKSALSLIDEIVYDMRHKKPIPLLNNALDDYWTLFWIFKYLNDGSERFNIQKSKAVPAIKDELKMIQQILNDLIKGLKYNDIEKIKKQCTYLEGHLLLLNITYPNPNNEIMKLKSVAWDDVLSRFNKFFNRASLSSSQLKLYRFVRNIQLFILKNKKDIQDGVIDGIIINILSAIFVGLSETEGGKKVTAFVQKWIDSIMSNIQKLLPEQQPTKRPVNQPTKRPVDQPTKRPVNQPKTREPLRF